MRRIWLYLLPLALIQPLFAQLPDYYKRVDRITWVVEDVDKVVQGWRKLGFEQIHEPTLVSLDHVRFRGSPARSKVRVAAGRLGAARIRWIQPVSGKNAYSEFLARHGSGVLSVVHRVPTLDALKAEIDRMTVLGVRVLEQGEVSSALGAVSYAYLDTEKEGKYSLGLIYMADAQGTEMPAQAPMDLKLSQYAFVVRDPRQVSAYWKKLGFPEMGFTHDRLRDLIHRGIPGQFDQELGWQRHGDIVYEWILPLKGPTVYQEYLKAHGEGFHHLAFDTEDIDRVTARWKDLGFPPVQSGAWGEAGNSGSGRFSYFDTTSIGGVTIEFLWNHR
jgi:methylmalonyl-CoA/ethylmalonyl-CoA epimerase